MLHKLREPTMKSKVSIAKNMLLVAILGILGSALLCLGYRASPSMLDKSISISEFRRQSQLSSAVEMIGILAIALAVGSMPRHRRRHPPTKTDGG